MATGDYSRFALPERVQRRTVSGAQAVADIVSITLLEVVATVVTAFVMLYMRGERPGMTGEDVLMRANKEAAVICAKKCRGGGKKYAKSRGVAENDGDVGSKGKVVVPVKARTGRR